MEYNSVSLLDKVDSLDSIKNTSTWDFLAQPYATMEADALLSYFQNRDHVQYFPLQKGTSGHVEKADQILTNVFSFNNEVHHLPKSFEWCVNPSQDIQWLILLHKFYYAKDLGAAYDYTGDEQYAKKWVELVLSWIANVPVGFVDSQSVGRRLQQWILSYHYFLPQKFSPSICPSFLVRFLRSIYAQTRYLSKHLSAEGNHRTIELSAIFLVAVLFPELRDAQWFLAFSQEEILKNMNRDILADGVQRELSTDYHHTVLKNFLRIRGLASLNHISLSVEYDNVIKKALEFSLYVHKPDGVIPAISDGDSNSYLSLLKKGYEYYHDENLLFAVTQGKRGVPPACRSKEFPDSGYYILRSDWQDEPYDEGLYFFFDCARVGAGSHGHYDLLNFEMAAYGHSLIIDPGRYTYSEKSDDGMNWRKVFKGTASHNTILVDGKDQLQYRRGKLTEPGPTPILKAFTTTEGFDFINGLAISYEYPVIHERKVFFLLPEYWIISDIMRTQGLHMYDLYFHLHPRAYNQTLLTEGEQTTLVTSPHLVIAQPRSCEVTPTIEEGFVSPQYGVKHTAPIIRFSQTASGPALYHTLLFPYRTQQPDICIEEIPVYDQTVVCPREQATALRITINTDESSYSDYFFLAHEDDPKEYTFEDIRYTGQLLLLRKDRHKNIVNLQAYRAHFLRDQEQEIIDFGGCRGSVSYDNSNLHIHTDAAEYTVALDQMQRVI